ncbi:MAG: hypothetical protein S4CHLAM7_03680 [Chlamydiae bacterium]|nr:hypothetical protein [Chlamydiota bacterium]
MWYRPGETMRTILENYPRRLVHTLAICGAFTNIAGSASFYWHSWWASFLIWIFLSIILGLFSLYILGGLIKWTGNWLKGSASMQQIMSVIAWSQVPVLYFFVIQLVLLAIIGGNSSNIVFASVRFLFAVWGFIIFLCCLKEAQAFSFFKAVINYVLVFVILLVVAVIISVLVAFFGETSPRCMRQTNPQSS